MTVIVKFDIDIYLLTAIALTSGGSSTVQIYTQTLHRTIQWNRIHRAEHIKIRIHKYENKNIFLITMIVTLIYLLTALGLTPGGSSTVQIYTQILHRTMQWNRIHRAEHTKIRIHKYDNKNIFLITVIVTLIYLLTAIGLTPGGSSTVQIYTQT